VAYTIMIGTTVLVLNDPVWETAAPGEEQLHQIASRIVNGVETVEQDASQNFPQEAQRQVPTGQGQGSGDPLRQ
jgi:hypothetical protein